MKEFRTNTDLEGEHAKDFGKINFEFTSPGTPQKNGVAEWGF